MLKGNEPSVSLSFSLCPVRLYTSALRASTCVLQAEAVSQLVNARTAAAADAALAGLSGGLALCVASVRAAAIDLLVTTTSTRLCWSLHLALQLSSSQLVRLQVALLQTEALRQRNGIAGRAGGTAGLR